MSEISPTDRLVNAVAVFLPDRTTEIHEFLAAVRAWLEEIRSEATVQSASGALGVIKTYTERLDDAERRLAALEAGGE